MDRIENPFAPNAGIKPPEFVGRKEILGEANILFKRVIRGNAEKHIILTGPRGVGKTVLLQELGALAEENGYCAARIEATGNTSLAKLLAKPLHKILLDLNHLAGAKENIVLGMKTLKSFLSGTNLKYGDLSIGLDEGNASEVVSNGNIELDLPDLLAKIAQSAKDKNKGIALLADELQFLTKVELKALTLSIHSLQQNGLPFAFIGAGLPMLPELVGDASSYSERIFTFFDVGELSRPETFQAISAPVRKRGAEISDEALDILFKDTKGYPYFVQEWGYQAWNLAPDKKIEKEIMPLVRKTALERLDKSFFPMRLERLADGEKEYLRVVAEQAKPYAKSGEVAKALGKKPGSMTVVRDRLIKKGILWSPGRGDLAFIIPLFGDYVRRKLPKDRTPRKTGVKGDR